MPRALFWFRWGAAWTWITGILLGGLIYYHAKIVLFEDPTDPEQSVALAGHRAGHRWRSAS